VDVSVIGKLEMSSRKKEVFLWSPRLILPQLSSWWVLQKQKKQWVRRNNVLRDLYDLKAALDSRSRDAAVSSSGVCIFFY